MRILVIASTVFELEEATAKLDEVEVLITGVGVPSTIYQLQKRLQLKNVDLVVQAGIAGSFLQSIPLGEVVIVQADTFADLGTEEQGNLQTIFDTGFANGDFFPFQDGWLINEHALLSGSLLKVVRAVTVNKVSDSALQKQQFIQKFSPGIETMEGAGLHYVCLLENVPFIQIRSISNFVGDRDKRKWQIKEAINHLNAAVRQLIGSILQPGGNQRLAHK